MGLTQLSGVGLVGSAWLGLERSLCNKGQGLELSLGLGRVTVESGLGLMRSSNLLERAG